MKQQSVDLFGGEIAPAREIGQLRLRCSRHYESIQLSKDLNHMALRKQLM
jgi:hypothetical protein